MVERGAPMNSNSLGIDPILMLQGTWGAIPKHHFHPNTHECYGIVKRHLFLGILI